MWYGDAWYLDSCHHGCCCRPCVDKICHSSHAPDLVFASLARRGEKVVMVWRDVWSSRGGEDARFIGVSSALGPGLAGACFMFSFLNYIWYRRRRS